jgi:hypothetical protein
LLGARGHLVGSGANRGIVNALVFAALENFGARIGVQPTVPAFPMTWSPVHCLEELFEPRAFAARDGRVVGLGHQPTRQRYSARCGDRVIAGMAVPHEEVATLTRRLPGVEIAFIYRIPPAALRALAA